MAMTSDEIGPWIEEEPDYPHEHEQWRNTETGGVIVIEEQQQPWLETPAFNALELPPSKEVGDNTDRVFIEKGTTKEIARESARDRMAEDAGQ